MKRVLGLLLLIAGTAACGITDSSVSAGEDWTWADVGKSCPLNAPATSLSGPKPSQPVSGIGDSNWAAIAREVPGGWGGFFIENGAATIYLVDPSQKEAAVSALGKAGVFVSSPVTVKKGRWDFAQMYDWNVFIREHLSQMGPGIHGIDVQEARNRLEYDVLDADARQRLGQLLASLDVPCFLVAVRIGPMSIAL